MNVPQKYLHFFTLVIFLLLGGTASAQEQVTGLKYNPHINVAQKGIGKVSKTTSLVLPFFEDFTDYNPLPRNSHWTDKQVYINNTMPIQPISRGVATFDGLNAQGFPYSTTSGAMLYADSLTSQNIDLSSYTPGDSIYISFVYQAGGNGFLPDIEDSLMLFFKPKTGSRWHKMWAISETRNLPFKHVLIPITDTAYLHSTFQFRFINKASFDINDDVWHLDYIRIDANRNAADSLIDDVAYNSDPTSLLNDYTSMPYKQYKSAFSTEKAAEWSASIFNNNKTPSIIASYGYSAVENNLGIPLNIDFAHSLLVPANNSEKAEFNAYANGSISTPGVHDKVEFTNTYYLESTSSDFSKANDTIVGKQVFDNYLAYDDGTAEMSYYLNLFPTLPGKIAIEHHLNEPDTLRGVAVYFGRQIPLATYKYFTIDVYEQIAYDGVPKDNIIYQFENQTPSYVDTVNHFWIYKFDHPVLLRKGTFYIGTTQPALSGSDSLYFGLDRNRKTGNHAYYNVLNAWQPSLVEGAIMIRPLIGRDIIGTTQTPEVYTHNNTLDISLRPNPATTTLSVNVLHPIYTMPYKYKILNIFGQVVLAGTGSESILIDISQLSSSSYFLHIFTEDNKQSHTSKFIKQ